MSSTQPRFQSADVPAQPPFNYYSDCTVKESNDIGTLTASSLKKLYLECYEECVYNNNLPQYLVRVSDMRFCSRGELWVLFRTVLDPTTITLDEATAAIESSGEQELRKMCMKDIMRLLKYAIFSHRWGEQELEFRDLKSKVHPKSSTPQGPGYKKVLDFCEKGEKSRLSVEDFPQEPWFTRGWTLQELLAPDRLKMYGKDWTRICPKEKETQGDETSPYPNDKLSDFMVNSISTVVHIHPSTIRKFDSGLSYPMISTKMRWASTRKTTRVEDTAYCLLGIFDIMMPIAYGEGDRAFQRLLETIALRIPSRNLIVTTIMPFKKRGIQLKLLVIPVQIRQMNDRHVIQLTKTQFRQDLVVTGHFTRTPRDAFDPDAVYVVGVVDFWLNAKSRDIGYIAPGKTHFGILLQIVWGEVGSGEVLTCRRIDTKGVLPLVECKSEYKARLETTLLEHTPFLIV